MKLLYWLIGGGIATTLVLLSAWAYGRCKKIADSTAGWDVDLPERDIPLRK